MLRIFTVSLADLTLTQRRLGFCLSAAFGVFSVRGELISEESQHEIEYNG